MQLALVASSLAVNKHYVSTISVVSLEYYEAKYVKTKSQLRTQSTSSVLTLFCRGSSELLLTLAQLVTLLALLSVNWQENKRS